MALKSLLNILFFLGMYEQTPTYMKSSMDHEVQLNRRLKGGMPSTEELYARVKRLQQPKTNGCGAVWYTGGILLTAASCFEKDESGKILHIAGKKIDAEVLEQYGDGLNENKKVVRTTAKAYIHEDFKEEHGMYENNIAVVMAFFEKSKTPIEHSQNLCGNHELGNEQVLVGISWNEHFKKSEMQLPSLSLENPYEACARFLFDFCIGQLKGKDYVDNNPILIVKDEEDETNSFDENDIGAPVFNPKANCIAGFISSAAAGGKAVTYTKVKQFQPWLDKLVKERENIVKGKTVNTKSQLSA